jgi:hypothetical protein
MATLLAKAQQPLPRAASSLLQIQSTATTTGSGTPAALPSRVHPYPALPHRPIPDRREEKEGGRRGGEVGAQGGRVGDGRGGEGGRTSRVKRPRHLDTLLHPW